MAAIANVYGWLKKTASPESRDWFDQARLRAFRSASNALNTLTTGKFLPNMDAYLRLQNDGVIIPHYRSVGATMQKIIEDVKKFAHCEFNYRFQVTADLPTEAGTL
jgi:5,10-methylenetetrahydrofolate reductase